tara:strand:- start:12149 stop:12682 length:534 start_codon:yes stop_codon:yes gene_type:complete
MSNKQNLNENPDALNLSVSKDDYESNKDTLSNAVGEEGSITISTKPKITTETEISENVKVDIGSVINALGINFFNKSPEQKAEIKDILNNTISILREKGLTNMIFRENEDGDEGFEWEDFEKADREVEYGVKSEDFDKLMEDLKKSGGPKIKIQETINPRIKKSDLINYIKTKNNVK